MWPILALLAASAVAQDLGDEAIRFPKDKMSEKCLKVLETKVDCPGLGELTNMDGTIDLLKDYEIELICTGDCRDKLEELRETIVATCDAEKDILEFNNYAWRPTLVIDKYISKYDMSCYKEKETGDWCDMILGSKHNNSEEVDYCSDCVLGPLQISLNSPDQFDEETVEQFESITSSCGATGYSFTTPTVNRLSALDGTKPTASPTAAPVSCKKEYVVQEGDTCKSIAVKQRVPSYDLVQLNSLDIYCSELPKVGSKMCLPEKECTTYELDEKEPESCLAIAKARGVTIQDILEQNEFLGDTCDTSKLANFVLCVEPRDAAVSTQITMTMAIQTVTDQNGEATTITSLEKPLAPGTITAAQGCTRYEDAWDPFNWSSPKEPDEKEVVSRNRCMWYMGADPGDEASFGMSDFVRWNPSLDSKDCVLDMHYRYCVRGLVESKEL